VRKMISIMLLTCLLVCESNRATAETVEEWTARRVAAITVPPPPHRLRGTAEKTYRYWHMAIAEVNICMDEKAVRSDHFWTAGKVGRLITQDLRAIPQEGVDPDAVNAISQIADTFDEMRGISRSMTDSASKLGIGFATGGSGDTANEGKKVLRGPAKVLDLLRAQDANDRKVRTLLEHRYGVPFRELILENASPAAGMWLGYDGVCAGG
jgi:hypothetical protein